MVNNFAAPNTFVNVSIFGDAFVRLFARLNDGGGALARDVESVETDRQNDDNEYLEFLPFYTIT